MIMLKSDYEYRLMKKAGEILAKTMNHIASLIQPGATMDRIDDAARLYMQEHQALPSFLGLYNYPYTICASINNEVIHGFPVKEKKLDDGDIVSIDMGCCFDGYHADMAYTFAVGSISSSRKKLLEVTKTSLKKAIEAAVCGARLGDIGYAVQQIAESEGFTVVRDYTGHGIGSSVHEEPQIPNFGEKGRGLMLQPGLALAIEPMINQGQPYVKTLPDRWTIVTRDGSDSAHFEHTVFIKESGTEILTDLSQGGSA